MSSGDSIKPEHLPADLAKTLTSSLPSAISSDENEELPKLPDAVIALEKVLIQNALKKTQGNKSKAAKLLGISERSLWYKLGIYGNLEDS